MVINGGDVLNTSLLYKPSAAMTVPGHVSNWCLAGVDMCGGQGR